MRLLAPRHSHEYLSMSRDLDQSTLPLTHTQQLIEFFQSGEKPASERKVGTEHEKFVFKRETGELLTFEEEGGFGDLFARLAEERGFEPSFDREHVVALTRDGAALTLEPGGQFELSGAILDTVFETRDEFDTHISEITSLAGDDLAFVSWGMNPFDALEDVPWMPKHRYEIMREYLPKRGKLAHWMMKMTCTVQANFDYTSEEDAADILRTSLRVSPVVSAMFCNSPLKQRQDTGMQSYRCHIWTQTDPARTGFPDFMYGEDWGYARYIEYVLDIPMFFIRREDGYLPMHGMTFRDFMAHGKQGYEATMGDFELHLSTIFPEVRMKRYIEVRGADAGSREVMLALPALWKGLLYDAEARRGASKMMVSSDPDQHRECFRTVHTEGLRASTMCGSFAQMAEELLDLSHAGLDRIAQAHGHPSEAVFLEPLRDIVEQRRTPADTLLAAFDTHDGDRMEIVNAFEFR